MGNPIKEIIRNSYFHLLVVFLVSVFLFKVNIIRSYVINFVAFAIILGLFGWSLLDKKKKVKVPAVFFYIALFLILSLRIVPFFYSNVPLGYDPGIYKYTFENPFVENWVLHTNPLLFSLVFYGLNLLFGSQFLLTIVLAILSSLVGLMLYFVVSKLFNKEAGIISVLIYLVSVAQFQAFWWNYIKNICGILLLLLSYLYFRDNKRINWKLILIGGLIAGFHRPAFLMFGVSYFVYVLLDVKNFKNKEFRNSVLNGVLIICLALLFNIDRITTFLLPGILGVTKSLVGETGSGTFFGLREYFYYSIPFIPFAITGFIKYWKKNIPIALGAVISSAFVILQLFFYNRFIIYFDIFIIVYAALGFYYLMQNKKLYGQIIFYGFIALFLVLMFIHAFNSRALISSEEFEIIKTYDEILDENSIIIVTSSNYSPWLKGYVNLEIIAPGLFDNNPWNRSEWVKFWENSTTRANMISELNLNNVYIHQGQRQHRMEWQDERFVDVGNGLFRFY